MPQSGIVKYHVKLSFEVDGLVERADIIGAIFGQTEGLLGPEMNLNELQRVSKVGRIEVNTNSTANTTAGDALIPMSTDIDTCALIAAAIAQLFPTAWPALHSPPPPFLVEQHSPPC